MQRHSDNALAVAEHLEGHKAVSWVSYPGLRSDRYHNLAKRYCPKGAGAVFTFGLRASTPACAWSPISGCSRTSPISATPARW